MNKKKYLLIAVSLFVFSSEGCAVLKYSEQIGVLRELEEERRGTEQYLDEQAGKFYQLLDDVKNGIISPGLSLEEVTNKYGRPFSEKNGTYIYSRPIDFLSSEKVYLYFDQNGILTKVILNEP
jgi:hypothetical protein